MAVSVDRPERRIEGLAVSTPDPQRLAPLMAALEARPLPCEALAGERLHRRFGLGDGHAVLHPYQLGQERLELVTFPDRPPRPPLEPGPSNALWFQHVAIVVSDLEQAADRLRPLVTPISLAPQWLPNGVGAWKFRNACGHAMELLCFPEGQGDRRWHGPQRPLFMGFDHTAIAVSDSDRSLAFYVAELRFQLRYATYNMGLEQDRLDALDQAQVAIHGVGPAQGCGVEFLRYLQPASPGLMATDLQPEDALYAQILVRDPGLAQGCLLHDPDGHRLWLQP